MSVLITDAEFKHALAIVQSLGKKDISLSCLSSNPHAPSFYSRYCFERIYFRNIEDSDRYAEFLVNLVKTGRYDIIIPCSDYSTRIISLNRRQISPYSIIFLPPHRDVEIVTSKNRLMRYAMQHDIPVPVTYFPGDISDLERIADQLSYPVVVKGERTTGAQQVRYVHSRSELVAKFNEISQKDSLPIIQDYIKGKDRFFYGLCDKGEVTAFFMLEVVRSYPPTGGTPARAVSLYDQRLKELAFRICKTINWTGILDMDFRQDYETEKYYRAMHLTEVTTIYSICGYGSLPAKSYGI